MIKLEKLEEAIGELILNKVMKEISKLEYEISSKVLDKKVGEINKRLSELMDMNLKIDEHEVQMMIRNMFLDIGSVDTITRDILDRFIEKIVIHDKEKLEIFYMFKK